MHIKAKFVGSFPMVKLCPQGDLPEFAFIGRSNVGKSSLINMLCSEKNLALVSQTPGKTRMLNYFIIDDKWHLVDLPGYGYAKVSKTFKAEFDKLINFYISKREQLTNLFILIDSNVPPQKIDLDFVEKIGEWGIPFSIIFTKTDKNKKGVSIDGNIQLFKNKMLENWDELPPTFISSAERRTGKEEILNYIFNIIKEI
ncbi:MAG: YihA family ribosome biogenesis GTP-binding protein [Saprospiraceae bacterium]|nr:YihA family ribosome biogenesis GTP-binding protein [Saprospiraceae bacterium]